jgi:hypothetical protein
MSLFMFFLLALATGRITWLITEDHLPLVARPRQWIIDRKPDGNLAYFVNCWFCTSVYVAAGAAAFAVWGLNLRPEVFAYLNPDRIIESMTGWKFFLLLWPALSFAGVGVMGAIDWLTSAPERD